VESNPPSIGTFASEARVIKVRFIPRFTAWNRMGGSRRSGAFPKIIAAPVSNRLTAAGREQLMKEEESWAALTGAVALVLNFDLWRGDCAGEGALLAVICREP